MVKLQFSKGSGDKKYRVIIFDNKDKKIKTVQFGNKKYQHYRRRTIKII